MAASSIEIVIRIERASLLSRARRFPELFRKYYKSFRDSGVSFGEAVKISWYLSSLLFRI